MLSRGNSNAAVRLRRAKSTSSTKASKALSDSKAMDPENAHPLALAAASHAYGRANNTRRSNATEADALHDALNAGEVHEQMLRQKKSIRFTGPSAVPSPQRHITVRAAPTNEVVSSSPVRSGANLESIEPLNLILETGLTALPQPVPSPLNVSSYRKLKKARSMFTPRKMRSFNFVSGAQDIRTPQHQRDNTLSSTDISKGHSRSQSHGPMVFRSTNTLGQTNEGEYEQDAVIRLARDEYLRQMEQQRLHERPSFLRLRKRQSKKAFPKTIRTNRTTIYGNAIGSHPSLSAESSKSFGSRARDISLTLKNKLKRAFQRGGDSSESLPIQQIDSQRLHFGDLTSTGSEVEHEELSMPTPDQVLLDRVSLRKPSPYRLPVLLNRTSSLGSIRSVSSHRNRSHSNSRVTSWTNSTAGNTLTRQQLVEGKRLSIIQENGGQHQPSLPPERKSSASHKGYGLFRKPLNVKGKENLYGSPVDSQRIFSALQKRFEEQNRIRQQGIRSQSDSPSQDVGVEEAFGESLPNLLAKPSVRIVSDTTRNVSNTSRVIKHSQSANFSKPLVGDADDVFRPITAGSIRLDSVGESTDLPQALTPQQIADHNEREDKERRKALREVRSAFFPSGSIYESRSISPFRNLLHSNGRDGTTDDVEFNPGPALATPRGNMPPFPISGRESSANQSESVYSRTTGHRTPLAYDSCVSLPKSDTSDEPGTALIIPSSAVGPGHSTVSTTHPNPSSTQSNADWKGWMASQVEALAAQDPGNLRASLPSNRRKTGHRRENAQMFHDETEVDLLGLSAPASTKQALAKVAAKALSRPSLEHKLSDQMVEKFPLRFPLVERPLSNNLKDRHVSAAIAGYGSSRQQIPNQENKKTTSSQPVQARGNSRPRKLFGSSTLQENCSPRAYVENINSSQPQLQDSHETDINCASLKTRSAALLNNRYSPERKERLRRMQSNVTQSPKSNTSSPRIPRQTAGYQSGKQTTDDYLIKTDSSDNLRLRNTGSFGAAGVVAAAERQSPGSQKMVNSFLSSRRRHMRMTEEEGEGERSPSPVFM